jgi:hypothetical protein
MTNSIYSNFAIRLYINQKYGRKTAPNRTNPFLYNGSVSFQANAPKLYVDLADFANISRSVPDPDGFGLPEHALNMAQQGLQYTACSDEDFLAGQVFELDSGSKRWKIGFVVMNCVTSKGIFFLVDETQLLARDQVVFRSCKDSKTNGTAPDLLGANYDLKTLSSTPKETAQPTLDATAMLKILAERTNR